MSGGAKKIPCTKQWKYKRIKKLRWAKKSGHWYLRINPRNIKWTRRKHGRKFRRIYISSNRKSGRTNGRSKARKRTKKEDMERKM